MYLFYASKPEKDELISGGEEERGRRRERIENNSGGARVQLDAVDA